MGEINHADTYDMTENFMKKSDILPFFLFLNTHI